MNISTSPQANRIRIEEYPNCVDVEKELCVLIAQAHEPAVKDHKHAIQIRRKSQVIAMIVFEYAVDIDLLMPEWWKDSELLMEWRYQPPTAPGHVSE